MAGISLRNAVIGDAEAIAAVHIDSWRATYRGLIPDADLDTLSLSGRTVEWRERLVRGLEVIVAVREERLVGFCALRRPDGGPTEIGALYLSPTVLGEGIGGQLMDEVVARLRARGESTVSLWVLAGNDRARSFYTRHGFVATGISEQWHGAPELQMARALASSSA